MARRRLVPPAAPTPAPASEPLAAPETKSAPPPRPAPFAAPAAPAPPVARAAGAAAEAAADALRAARRLAEAEAAGRLLLDLPLDAIDPDHLARDRVPGAAPDEEAEALIASLRAHGQRSPAEVVRLGPDRYGLISGWRRLAALRALWAETGDPRFAVLRAALRGEAPAPDAAPDPAAYIAMVEENEIRLGLTPYERGRIAALAAGRGAFESTEAAVDALFAAASRAKRSKIRSFALVHERLGRWLFHPAAIPERLGLRIAEALRAGGAARAALFEVIAGGDPYRGATAERTLLERAVRAAEAVAEEDAGAVRPGRPPVTREALSEGLWLVERVGAGGATFRLEGPRASDPAVIAAARRALRGLA